MLKETGAQWGYPAHCPPRGSHPARLHSPVGSPDLPQDLRLQRHGSGMAPSALS